MSAAYPATALLARDEIRLIRLLPGAWKDDIHCELVYDRLASVRPYQALSYVWGSSKRAKTISLDGQSFAVTVNLESTLRHLRSRTQDTLLWIDALCINQANDSERTHQVNLMGNIYRSSQGVLVYLGDGIGRRHRHRQESKLDSKAPRRTQFLDNVEDMSHIQRVLQPDAFQASDSLKDGESDRRMQETVDIFSFVRTLSWVNHLADIPWLASNTDNPGTDKALMYIFESLRRLMHAPFTPWWGRIWVVQEVILPPQVTVICGTVSAPWSIFARAASKGLHHLHHCCAKDLQHLPRDVLNVLQDFGERVTDIDHLRKTCLEELGHTKRSYPDSDIPELDPRHLSTEQRSLTALLRRFRGRKASDPRDKVYALLSLVEPSPHRPPLMPDYSLSSAEVYTLAALESIYSSASLTVLSVDNTRKYRQDLPSWVPDWEAPGDFSYNTRMDAMSMYEACAEYPVNPDTVRVRGRGLIIESLNVDVVAECGPVMLSDSSETFLETMVKWLFLKRGFTAVKETTNTDKVLWRVLCADVILSHPGIDDSGDLFRRMEDEDELLFVTWALTSRRSPFFDRKIPLREYVSATARLWMEIIDFETSIFKAETKTTGHMFFSLFPDQAMRKDVIEHALGLPNLQITNTNRHRDISGEENIRRLIEYAAFDRENVYNLDWTKYVEKIDVGGQSLDGLEEAQIIPQMLASETQSERNRLKAWKEVPWGHVLEMVRPLLLGRLGSASKVGQIPYDVQASLIERSIVSATKARRFFITRRGYVGLGPTDLKRRDTLYLLQGSRTPLILRSVCASIAQLCPADVLTGIKCPCSDCLKHLKACSGCIELFKTVKTSCKVIGDCYAFDFMDSRSVREHMRKRKTRIWRKINLL